MVNTMVYTLDPVLSTLLPSTGIVSLLNLNLLANASLHSGLPSCKELLTDLSSLTVITPTDQSGVILVITALPIIFALLSIFNRVYIQLQLRHAFEANGALVSIAMVRINGANSLELELTLSRYSR